jgi:phospholipase/carboxylesterase
MPGPITTQDPSAVSTAIRPIDTEFRSDAGGAGLVVGLHGYGADHNQLDSLIGLTVPAVTIFPKAPLPVDPGWGWWRPAAADSGGPVELAPTADVDEAVALVRDLVTTRQRQTGFGPTRTVLVGYSQGATLALSVAARHPELMAGVATAAGFLLPNEHLAAPPRPLRVLIMNGTLDRLITQDLHDETVRGFRDAGHRVESRRDKVPHVVDTAQGAAIDAFARTTLGLKAG